ncbi:hypothetical protein RMATCC62417_13639 [Rhizopus microsporus]|nr:hypothetical protein RMATCC62417_13639 [Rhizopus microsporus]
MPRYYVPDRSKRLNKNFTLVQKAQIIDYMENTEGITQVAVTKWAQKQFGLVAPPTQSTINKLWKFRHKYDVKAILEGSLCGGVDRKTLRKSKYPELEKLLIDDIIDCQKQNVPLSGNRIKQMGENICRFDLKLDPDSPNFPSFSNGWFERFKKRHGLTIDMVGGEPSYVVSQRLHSLDTTHSINQDDQLESSEKSKSIGDEPSDTTKEDLKRKEAMLDALHTIMKYHSFFGADQDANFYNSCQIMYERIRKDDEQQPQGKQKKLTDYFQS